MKVKKIKKLIIIAVALITLHQVFSTISICNNNQNIQMIYEVKSGENLVSIAKRFDTTPEKLQQLNNISVLIVDPGTRLKID